MRNYDELIKDLREYAERVDLDVWDCPYMIVDSMKQAADAIEELSAIRDEQKAQIILMAAEIEEQQSRWISVTERLPELNENVLVYSAHSGLICIDANIWFDRNATHWMPMPQPPKETTDG